MDRVLREKIFRKNNKRRIKNEKNNNNATSVFYWTKC